MASAADNQKLERDLLRNKYKEAISDLIKALDSQAKAGYGYGELTGLGISLRSFDPDNEKFPDSTACLFRPMSSEEFENYSIDKSDLDRGAIDYYVDFDKTYDAPKRVKNASHSYTMRERAFQIYRHLQVCYLYCKTGGRETEFLDEISGWSQIKHDNSFLINGERLMEWQEDYDDPETLRPHIMLTICTGAEPKDNELLFSELGSIAQAIENRLQQKEFEKTSLFPGYFTISSVLAISLFGPRHGRLLQAHFNKSGMLKVLVSPIYKFLRRDDAPSELFLRYYTSVPQDGPEYQFYSDEEDTSAQHHQYVSPSPGSNIENIPPNKVHRPSSEEA
ncbi:hypothetical protein PVAR5_6890 [Paecilomyces variotii No. 5]|uniref:Uncharacterized protein n=1 Tax=Byssochlamys spectabilis (strain No. 5 / NBRC 109023) TaxID=1356009 RepID=V5FK02_BYSSN|nr:hypothetical protein PVAR5_6890 [Paecilomyces variotii No. 5]